MTQEPARPEGTPPGLMTVTEVTGLVQLFSTQLLAMEGRLVAKMDDNSRLASARWEKHDHDADRTITELDRRFGLIETGLAAHITVAEGHWNREHEEELILQARIKPVTSVATYVARNWRTILLMVVSLLAILGFSTNTFREIFGL